jgi:hypothetical protein
LFKTSARHDAYLYVEQKDAVFVQLLWNLLNSIGIVGAAPHTRRRTDKRTKNTSTSTLFATFTHPFFTDLFRLWYHNVDGKNIKVIPANLANLLTPVSLAYWISSDGNYRKLSGIIVLCNTKSKKRTPGKKYKERGEFWSKSGMIQKNAENLG